MRKTFFSLAVVVALIVTLGVSTGSAAAWTYANAFWRTREWAEFDENYPSYEPYECKGPYENGHERTQWACKGDYGLNKLGNTKWQVNIDAYGVQTYWHAE